MSDLISRKDVLDFIGSMNMCDQIEDSAYKELSAHIDNLPTVDAEPVKHGEWKVRDIPTNHDYVLYYCSECETNYVDSGRYNYCPACGAKMKGAEHETYLQRGLREAHAGGLLPAM